MEEAAGSQQWRVQPWRREKGARMMVDGWWLQHDGRRTRKRFQYGLMVVVEIGDLVVSMFEGME